ncbi:MAG: hypothetical protein GX815_05815, partial [Clostridiales bacterium]|nr:hypothetical protein [Clostridiales bacterium]
MNTLKRYCRVLVFMLIVLGILSGCQKTPNDPAVIGKNLQSMIDKAKLDDDSETSFLRDRINAPETYKGEFTSSDKLMNVVMDASIFVPDAKSVLIIRVSSGSILQKQVDVLIENLVHVTLFDPYASSTQDTIMQEILTAQQRLAAGPTDYDEGMTYYDDNGKSLTWEEWMLAHINSLNEKYLDATNSEDAIPITGQFETDGGGLYIVYGSGISSEWGCESIQIHNGEGKGHSRALFSQNIDFDGFSSEYELSQNITRLPRKIDITEMMDPAISAEEAQRICDDLTSKLELDNMKCYSILKKYGVGYDPSISPRCCWALQYTRFFDGVPLTYTSDRGNTSLEGAVGEPWIYETLTYYVNDNGIVDMWWEAPYDIGETIIANSRLLSFEEVIALFEKMYLVKNAGIKADVKITDIRLGYTRITEQNRSASAILIPVWDFFGITVNDGTVTDDPEESLLTINGIDGSII